MDRVDAMKKLQGWTDTSVLHFRNLAMFGEQILLAIRWGAWSDVHEPDAGVQLGAFLAAADPGLHPRLPRRHRRRAVGGDGRHTGGRDDAIDPVAAPLSAQQRGA